MRIQVRLFLGTAALVLALVGAQWWLHTRQLRAVEDQFAVVATSVGTELLAGEHKFLVERFLGEGDVIAESSGEMVWIEGDYEEEIELLDCAGGVGTAVTGAVHVLIDHEVTVGGETGTRTVRHFTTSSHASPIRLEIDEFETTVEGGGADESTRVHKEVVERALADLPHNARRIMVKVIEGEDRDEPMLVVRADTGVESKIPIPLAPAVEELTSGHLQGVAISGALLGIGLIASALMARRVARPLQNLAGHAEALGRGDFGAQIDVDAGGEVGELQVAFNRMSMRLAELEEEKARWSQREHLAQLGDLSRGLAHTLRNPLNTLGLAVEELAGDGAGKASIATTARAQITRIDRWLRSFLALGAGDAAEVRTCDLSLLVQNVVLEAVQQGTAVSFEPEETTPLEVEGVETALTAALSNLVENGAQATPDGSKLDISLSRRGDTAVVRIADRGPGLPDEVRQRLYSPHVTTRVGGSGMGLFLARQLIVGMHGGELEIRDRDGGGTDVEVRLGVRR